MKLGPRRAVGCMTGTSIDAVDVALLEIRGHGMDMQATLRSYSTRDLSPLRNRLRAAASQTPLPASEFCSLADSLARAHIEPIAEVIRDCPADAADLICVHGQTVFHQPPLSWQLMNPAPIAAAFGCPVWHDLRAADLALEGEGAPITPIADWILFRQPGERRAIVNLGGFCNVTNIPDPATDTAEAITGGDLCACNQLLDAITRETIGEPFDADGRMALAGKPDRSAVEELSALLAAQSLEGRSLGTGDELTGWISRAKSCMKPQDIAASAVASLCLTVSSHVGDADCIVLAGGGFHNLALRGGLMTILVHELDKVLVDTGVMGIPVEMREAACFAVLGALCEDGVPITLPQVTGCTVAPRSGSRTYIPR